ncbi:membrane protein [Bordetella pertussis]|nr:membrane protein [Bordetella pertussis]
MGEIGVIANNGDHSTAYRVQLLLDMYAQIREMPWWQWAFGLGLGQLNLMWPATDAQWASPHFFWLEMFFHLGLLWVAFLGWLLVRSDSTGRICLITAAIAGMAPSSMIYLQPFWFLVGVCVAVLPQKNGAPSRPAALPQHASQ